MKEGFQNWMIVFSIIVVGGIITNFTLSKREDNSEQAVKGVESIDYKTVPFITSLAPISMKVGENLDYRVAFSDLDSYEEELELYLTESPSWIYLEDNIVKGVPYEAGTYKYTVTVSDGVNSSSQINYILVEDNG